jgi:molybdopterin synthase catalytic subunit
MISIVLTDQVISLPQFIAEVESTQAGAVATFSGNVRASDQGKEVVSLSYEIHPSTEQVLDQVVRDVASHHDILGVAVGHRFGEIAIGESALIVAISSEHRREAFDACAEMVNEVKARIPIWKHQVFADGSDEWENCA